MSASFSLKYTLRPGLALLATIQFCTAANARLSVTDLKCERLVNPVSIDAAKPALSWVLRSDRRATMQTAYEIEIRESGKAVVWSSGRVASDKSVQVIYEGPALVSGQRYDWKVRVWDNHGESSAWSTGSTWRMGLLKSSDWSAQWIESGRADDTVNGPAILFRNTFRVRKPVREAFAWITSHGLYLAAINGTRVGDGFLTPGWTSYNKRLQYQAYDITALLRRGDNAIGVSLASGWYRGPLASRLKVNNYGSQLGLLAQLIIRYTDGSADTVVTDGSWRSATGPVRSSEIYHGEVYDARLERSGWTTTSYTENDDWQRVRTAPFGPEKLVATVNEPVRKQEEFRNPKLIVTPKGEQVLDYGQNLVGWVQVRANGRAGDSIRITHAEVLDKDGNFYTTNLRLAKAAATYVLNGKGIGKFEPHFTFFGFRYARIEGLSGTVNPADFPAIAVYSDTRSTGKFSCSNPLINQLQQNIQWGQKDNFVDIPTDCPQRDERLGWTGDALVFARTAAWNADVDRFFTKWLRDLAADQRPDGSIPNVIPDFKRAIGGAGWCDAATVVPWTMYEVYADRRLLEEQYPSMKAWVDYMRDSSRNDLYNSGSHFGDWLYYSPQDDRSGRAAVTDKFLIAQCFYAYSTQLLIKAATALGKTGDAHAYEALLTRIKKAFCDEYLTPNGSIVSNTQTAYVLALQFDMLPVALRRQAADRLVQNIRSYNDHLTTGFLGTPWLCHALSRFGHTDVAYRLLLQDTYPSWLYPVKMGATTIWERWDGIFPDSSFQTPSMNSYNHYAYGAIGDWMYRTVAGIDIAPDGPGYKKSVICPQPGGGLLQASGSIETVYGALESSWKIIDGHIQYNISIPANTRSGFYLPAASASSLTEHGRAWRPSARQSDRPGYSLIELGSGSYQFEAENRNP